MNQLNNFNNLQIEKLSSGKDIPSFRAGDTISVHVNNLTDSKVKMRPFVGLCIARKNAGLHSSFIVRKSFSLGMCVEKMFLLHSPLMDKVEVIKYGKVRRAKLYYIRNRSGKSARIKERKFFSKG